jgi:hypothetical protein
MVQFGWISEEWKHEQMLRMLCQMAWTEKGENVLMGSEEEEKLE